MAAQKQDDLLERTFSSYVRIQDVVLKTYLGRWTIGRSGERGSGISVLPARYDDDDDDDIMKDPSFPKCYRNACDYYEKHLNDSEEWSLSFLKEVIMILFINLANHILVVKNC